MPSRSHSTRHIPLHNKLPVANDWEAVNKYRASALSQDVRRIQQSVRGMRVRSHDGIYTGVSGIAFTEYHLSGMPLPLQDHSLTPKSLIAAADKHLSHIVRHHSGYYYSSRRLSFIESSIGIATLVLARGLWTLEETLVNNWKTAKDYLEDTIDHVLAEDSKVDSPGDKEDGCEVLYGRAGLLYALLYLRKTTYGRPQQEIAPFGQVTSEANLSRLVDSIMSRGKHGAFSLSSELRVVDRPHLPPLMWTWHGKRYLVGAHGAAAHFCHRKASPRDFYGYILARGLSIGNWPSKWPCPTEIGVSADNDLVQWWHGALEMVILLSTSLRVLHAHEDMIAIDGIEEKIRRSLHLSANLAYQNGLLRKGVGLCPGVAGPIYAVLAASDALDPSSNRGFLMKAAHLAFLATFREDMTSSGEISVPNHPWSLYEGLSGACCAWAEVMCRLDSNDPRRLVSGFPGYHDLAEQ